MYTHVCMECGTSSYSASREQKDPSCPNCGASPAPLVPGTLALAYLGETYAVMYPNGSAVN